MRTLSIALFFSTVLMSVSFADETVKTRPVAPQINKSQPARLAAPRVQIVNQMRALGFNVADVKNSAGNTWQVTVAGWDPGQAQASYRNALKWDPTIRNPSDKNTSVRWDPFDGQAAKKGSANWDPNESSPATLDVEYSAGNVVLSKGSLQSLGIVQGSRGFPQGMQMR